MSVVGPDLVQADIDATTAMALGTEAPHWLARREQQRGLLVWEDGSTELVEGCGVPHTTPLLSLLDG